MKSIIERFSQTNRVKILDPHTQSQIIGSGQVFEVVWLDDTSTDISKDTDEAINSAYKKG
ncbi:MAG: hypothetical protein ACPGXL_02550 [Chitinophagales bacterium]